MLELGELGEMSFQMLELGKLDEVSFRMLEMGELGKVSFSNYEDDLEKLGSYQPNITR